MREIMEDPIFKGNQNYKFEMDLDEAGKRLFGGEANAGVAFQIGQLRYKQLFCKYTPVCTSTYMYILVHTSTFKYIPVYTGTYYYVLARPDTMLFLLNQILSWQGWGWNSSPCNCCVH